MVNIHKLHDRNVVLFSAYRDLEGSLIDALQEFDRHRGFQKMGFSSLFNYCQKGLGMSENQAFTLIRVSRKSIEVPALKEALVRKEITLTSARLISSVITQDNQAQWLEKAKTLTKPALERELVRHHPKMAKADRFIPLTPTLSEARGVLSQEAQRVLERVKEIESKRTSSCCDLDAAILAMGKAYLSKNDPVEKARRRLKHSNGTQSTPLKSTGPQAQSKKIAAATIHKVNTRDRGRCQAKHNGKICGSRHFSQIHHIIPRKNGGENSLDNLVTLCGGHHKSLHLNGEHLECVRFGSG